MPVVEGEAAPGFQLESTEGKTVKLSDLRGSKVVLYFYPKDDTPGCTQESCDFRDSFADFEKAGAVIYGISPDPIKKHHKFRAKYKLPFPLLADPEHTVLELYNVWKEKLFWGRKCMGVERTTVVIDSKGKVARLFPKVDVKGHHAEVLAAVKVAD